MLNTDAAAELSEVRKAVPGTTESDVQQTVHRACDCCNKSMRVPNVADGTSGATRPTANLTCCWYSARITVASSSLTTGRSHDGYPAISIPTRHITLATQATMEAILRRSELWHTWLRRVRATRGWRARGPPRHIKRQSTSPMIATLNNVADETAPIRRT